jgi:hypothetical protein
MAFSGSDMACGIHMPLLTELVDWWIGLIL